MKSWEHRRSILGAIGVTLLMSLCVQSVAAAPGSRANHEAPRTTGFSQKGAPQLMNARQVSAASSYACAVTASKKVACWGRINNGQMGRSKRQILRIPSRVSGLRNVTQVSAGAEHVCAITNRSKAFCWGRNQAGELGTKRGSGSENWAIRGRILAPVAIKGLGKVKEISSGGMHSCAIRKSGQAVCWGGNYDRQLGIESRDVSYRPVRIPGFSRTRSIAAGTSQTCAVKSNGKVFCWGRTNNGSGHARPVRIGRFKATQVSTAPSDSIAGGCALLDSGHVSCWNYNAKPRLIRGISGATDVSGDLDFGCASNQEGKVLCWSNNFSDRLPPNAKAAPLDGFTEIDTVATTDTQTVCGLAASKRISCWGKGSDGELGNGIRRSVYSEATEVLAPDIRFFTTPELPAGVCVKAGIRKPFLRAFMVRENIPAHPGNVQGVGGVRFRAPAMPDGCDGYFGRTIEVRVRYQTSAMPLRNWNYLDSRSITWWPLCVDNACGPGPNVTQFQANWTAWFKRREFGRITRVLANARVRVWDLQRERVIKQIKLKFPARFKN